MKRLSNMAELKSHEFFKGIDWKKASNLELKPPFIPKFTNEKDLKYFDKVFNHRLFSL